MSRRRVLDTNRLIFHWRSRKIGNIEQYDRQHAIGWSKELADLLTQQVRRLGIGLGPAWPCAQVFSGRSIEVPSCFIAGASDWGVYQKPGAFE